MPSTAGSYISEVDPSPVEQARQMYSIAAAAGRTDGMVLLANLLAYQMDPPDLGRAQRWYQQAAAAGNTEAMVGLGNLIGYRLDPPNLAVAQHWYEQAAQAGDPDGWYGLGTVLARLGDRAGVEQAWRCLIETVSVDAQTAAAAALGLAALAGLDGLPTMAVPLLQVATMCGSALAAPCAGSLSADAANRQRALQQLAEQQAQTPALNFLGVAAYHAGARSEAILYWRRSDSHGDTVAPLLLHLTAAGSDSSCLTEAARHRRNPIGTAPTPSTR